MKNHTFKTILFFMAALVLCPLLRCLPAKADASGCVALEVEIYDAQTGKRCEDSVLSSLAVSVSENGHFAWNAEDVGHSATYTRKLIGDSWNSRITMKSGSKYDVEISLPESYELKSARSDSPFVTSDHYTVSGKTLSFTYDSVIEKAAQEPGVGLTFSLEFFNGPKPAPKPQEPEPDPTPEPDPAPQETEPETSEPTPNPSQKLTTVIRVPQTEYTLTAGAKSFSLNASVENGTVPVYQSSDSSVIKVSKNGKITVKKPGKAVVSISSAATDQYTGATVSVSFTVTPKKVTSVKATSPKTKKAAVSWKKVNSATGYEVSLATNKTFTKNVKTIDTKSVKATVSGLKKGATYYVRVRAYKLTDDDSRVSGAYSSVKKVNIK